MSNSPLVSYTQLSPNNSGQFVSLTDAEIEALGQ